MEIAKSPMLPLPELKQLDIATPIKDYYATKRQNEIDTLKKESLATSTEMDKLKLNEFKATSQQRGDDALLQRKMQKVATDKALTEWGVKNLLSVDPESKDFDKEIVGAVGKYRDVLVNNYGFSAIEGDRIAQQLFQSGVTTPEAIKKLQAKEGLRDAPARSVSPSGQLVTVEGDKATATDIAGYTKKNEADTQLGKLIVEMNQFPTGDPRRTLYEQAINKEVTKSKSGETIRMNPDGSVEILRGDAAVSDLGKTATNKIQDKMIDTSESLVRLNNVKQSYTDMSQQYLTVRGKARIAKIDAMLKSGVNVSPDDKAYMQSATDFAAKSLTNLNKTLNELSGAAVTQQEFERISQTMPNPGTKGITNIFSGDNSIEFETKLNESLRMQQMALARLSYVNNNGYTGRNNKGEITGFFDNDGKKISIDNMPQIMKDRANKIADEISAKSPGMSQVELAPLVQQAVASEFGLIPANKKSTDVIQPQPLGSDVLGEDQTVITNLPKKVIGK